MAIFLYFNYLAWSDPAPSLQISFGIGFVVIGIDDLTANRLTRQLGLAVEMINRRHGTTERFPPSRALLLAWCIRLSKIVKTDVAYVTA
ncbi:MAG: hypothetical protein L3J79_05010 [Candidatus Marinimicrobia bacterium]|nr:hypothetical protein [Candidatus Neomarinimicrobiota bacterium]